ncbi:adenosylmethionine decarboxylase [Priestia megaterium]|uniref:adenosylmethionine decarboxylase n=1 Tax=Priestia megaterium TaxID=1404 RepID=UPI00211C8E71|nr:adenosylmethionine decarboxylase [Priestia megaterium]
MDIKGKHLLMDAFECDEGILNAPSLLRRILVEAALDAEMEVLHCYFHQFTPQGITGILVLATSHLSIHTWPEENYASLDFYTCGDKKIIEIGYALLKQLASKKAVVYSISRGIQYAETPTKNRQHAENTRLLNRGDDSDHVSLKQLLSGQHDILFHQKNRIQDIQLIKASDIRMYLDEQLQFSSLDEHAYHEALVHPIFAASLRPHRILILGGGDGLALREVLKYKEVKEIDLVEIDLVEIDLVEIDADVVNAAMNVEELKKLNQRSFEDSRVTVHIQDAVDYLSLNSACYDIIIIDFPDPTNKKISALYTKEFYALLHRSLSRSGLVVCQSNSPRDTPIVFWSINKTMKASQFYTLSYHTIIPSFGDWGFHIGSKTPLSAPILSTDVSSTTLPSDFTKLMRFSPHSLSKKQFAVVNSAEHLVLHKIFKKEGLYL